MKKIILILILFTFPLKAEIISATGKHKHLGDKTKIQSCRIAEEKAKKKCYYSIFRANGFIRRGF